MELLYRLFFIILAMSLVTAVLTPIVLILRSLLKKAPARYMVLFWGLYFLRAIVPIAAESPLCIVASWNRRYYLVLEQMGVQMQSGGTVDSWWNRIQGEISVDKAFAICSVLWLICVVIIWLYAIMRQRKIKKMLKKAEHISDKTYQVEGLFLPVQLGLFRSKTYIASETTAKEAKYIWKHMKIHRKRKDRLLRFFAFLICSLHWFNPFVWIAFYFLKKDIETACDEAVVSAFGEEECREYAQAVLNMKRGKGVNGGRLYTFWESFVEERARLLFYYEEKKKRYISLAFVVACICVFWWFFLRPVQLMWNGGIWSTTSETTDDKKVLSENASGSAIEEGLKAMEQWFVPATDEEEKIESEANQDDALNTKEEETGTDASKENKSEENDKTDSQEGIYTLEDSMEKIKIKVYTKKDKTGNQEIEKIAFPEKTNGKVLEDIKGYFCELAWVKEAEKTSERYAVLVYNGVNSRTFTIYDVEKGEVYHSQEDGNKTLFTIFEQYNDEVSFLSDSVVVYKLQKIQEDILYIGFAISLSDGSSISGSYEYDTKEKTAKNLSYSK